jgi:hypothetical protein
MSGCVCGLCGVVDSVWILFSGAAVCKLFLRSILDYCFHEQLFGLCFLEELFELCFYERLCLWTLWTLCGFCFQEQLSVSYFSGASWTIVFMSSFLYCVFVSNYVDSNS